MKELFLPGELVSTDQSLVKGHGTHTHDTSIISSTLGFLSKINKVVFIEPLFPLTYAGQIGDVVIGRVHSIYNKRWVLAGNAASEMYLNFSAIMFPGIEPRLRLEEDELKMREYFDINDLVCGQVQKIHRNGGMAIHTRNEKFKKLRDGVCVAVPVFIIKRFKSQFMHVNDVEIIVGMNGFVWIGGCNGEGIRKAYNYIMHCKTNMEVLREEVLLDI